MLHLAICDRLLHKIEQLGMTIVISFIGVFVLECLSLELHLYSGVRELHYNGMDHVINGAFYVVNCCCCTINSSLDMLTFSVNITRHPIAIILIWLNFMPDSHEATLSTFVALDSISTCFVWYGWKFFSNTILL